MINTDNLIKEFEKAGLKLVIPKTPIRNGSGMKDIVQMDIQRGLSGNIRSEYFRIYPGHEDNSIQVRDTDKKSAQVVLMVHEKARWFEETVRKLLAGDEGKLTVAKWVEGIKSSMRWRGTYKITKIFVDKADPRRGSIVISRKTDDSTRYFLMGVDERQLFISQISQPVTTVDQARRCLGSTIQFAEGKRKGSSIDRQGEWFFLETNRYQRDYLENLIKKHLIAVHKKVAIGQFAGRSGKPHTVDELVVLENNKVLGLLEHGFPVRNRQIYIRGAVRHSDHKTVRFSEWREVIANNETAAVTPSFGLGSTGVFWVD